MSIQNVKLKTALLSLMLLQAMMIASSNSFNPYPKMEELRKTKIEPITQMRFLVFGDSKGSPVFQDTLKSADEYKPDFCITTADLVHKGAGPEGAEDYANLYLDSGWFLQKYPVWPSYGNHEDSGGDDGVENFIDFYEIPSDEYSFVYGNAKFIALTWKDILGDPKRVRWLEEELKSAGDKHIFVFGHRPFYTVGQKSKADTRGRETGITRLFSRYKVKAVFGGHDHIYYRTKRDGVHYIISAGAGASIYKLKRENEAIRRDAYYGQLADEKKYVFQDDRGNRTYFDEPLFYTLAIEIDGGRVELKMIENKSGKILDEEVLK